jgi:hypothetical protein
VYRHELDCLGVGAQVRTALGSDGGVADGIATVQGHVQGVLMQEEAAAALSRGQGGPRVSHHLCKAAKRSAACLHRCVANVKGPLLAVA